jgi:hypothetical protein
MSASLPLITSDILSNKYIFNLSNKNLIGGMFSLQTNNINEIINKVLEYDYNIISFNSRNVYLLNFTSNIMTEKYHLLYNKIV